MARAAGETQPPPSREPFSATNLAAEAVGAAPTIDALRSAYATAAEVCSDEFLHAAGYQRQVTPGGLRFEPIPTGPTRVPAMAYERAIPPFPVAPEQPVPAWPGKVSNDSFWPLREGHARHG